ncbi:carboxyl-terminal protease [Fibrella sp. HMF5335]|uniref:Carboxyl-terminal protease n=1 Tax=Fibrella rubiginis TaxID=2817060 RepID=A0A939GKV9_9BACT|nr:S41 family peptidase [Fibrella rubiginis]MBO0939290.1 carboxyl-terminal protease [Fibrella rubiginis]
MNRILILLIVGGLLSLGGCHKAALDAVTPVTTVATTTPDIRDSLYLYMKDMYLWYDKLPATFNTRAFTDPTIEMDTLRTVQPLDRWSFVEKAATFNSYFANGQTGDYGFWIKYDANNDLRVRYVYAQSPAGLAGVKRGWKLTTINGQDVKTMTSTAIVDAFYGTATSTTFGFDKPDGITVTSMPLTVTNYTLNTVLYSNTYSVNGKTVGYLVFNSFTGTPSQQELATALNRFESAGVSDLIVDLRYNGGGDVSTQEYLANRLAPVSVGSSPMYSTFHNAKLSGWNKTVNFAKTGSLNLSRVFFITTSGTASASELLINNLKPYLDVKTIGSVTHGKPVGMYGFNVMDYVLAPIAFRTVNAKNVGDYFNGLPVDVSVVDGPSSDWGDPNEACLATALHYITNGSFANVKNPSANARESASSADANRLFDGSTIRPMLGHLPVMATISR